MSVVPPSVIAGALALTLVLSFWVIAGCLYCDSTLKVDPEVSDHMGDLVLYLYTDWLTKELGKTLLGLAGGNDSFFLLCI